MRKMLFAICLLFSFSAFADYTQDWNKRFSELNNVPLNLKWAPSGQQNYYKQLMATRPDYFKNPDNYPRLTAPPVTPLTPAVTPATTAHELIARIRRDLDALENLK